jgi:hypothetical protein
MQTRGRRIEAMKKGKGGGGVLRVAGWLFCLGMFFSTVSEGSSGSAICYLAGWWVVYRGGREADEGVRGDFFLSGKVLRPSRGSFLMNGRVGREVGLGNNDSDAEKRKVREYVACGLFFMVYQLSNVAVQTLLLLPFAFARIYNQHMSFCSRRVA